MPIGRMRWVESGRLYRPGPVSRGRRLSAGQRRVHQPEPAGWDDMHRDESLRAGLRLRRRRLHGEQPGRLFGERSVPSRGDLQSGDGCLLGVLERAKRDALQRRQRLYDERLVHRRYLRGDGGNLHRERRVPYRRHV
jgi:hypothetical protein